MNIICETTTRHGQGGEQHELLKQNHSRWVKFINCFSAQFVRNNLKYFTATLKYAIAYLKPPNVKTNIKMPPATSW